MVLYEVVANCADSDTAAEWTRWMLDKHIADVVAAGALRGRLLRVDGPSHQLIAQYEFESRPALDTYLAEHAPRLRAEGLQLFGAERISYSRRVSQIL